MNKNKITLAILVMAAITQFSHASVVIPPVGNEVKQNSIIKTFAQKTQPVLEKTVAGVHPAKPDEEVKAVDIASVVTEKNENITYTVTWNRDDKVLASTTSIVALKASTSSNLFQEKWLSNCIISSKPVSDGDISITQKSKDGFAFSLTPTQLSEDGVTTLVSLDIKLSKLGSQQFLTSDCSVYDLDEKKISITRVVDIPWGRDVEFPLEDGSSIKVMMGNPAIDAFLNSKTDN